MGRKAGRNCQTTVSILNLQVECAIITIFMSSNVFLRGHGIDLLKHSCAENVVLVHGPKLYLSLDISSRAALHVRSSLQYIRLSFMYRKSVSLKPRSGGTIEYSA